MPASPQPNSEPHGTPPAIEASLKAFGEALPQLLRERAGQWVAYHAGRQLGFAETKTELYQRCLAAGLRRGEFIVRLIQPQVEVVTLDPRMAD